MPDDKQYQEVMDMLKEYSIALKKNQEIIQASMHALDTANRTISFLKEELNYERTLRSPRS